MYRANWQPLFIDHVTFQKHGLVEVRHTWCSWHTEHQWSKAQRLCCHNGGVHEMEPSVSDMEMAPTDQAELHYIMTSSLLMEWCSECLTTLACGLWWMLTCALRKIWYLLLHAKSPTWLGGLKVQDFMARLHQNINKEVLQPSTETPFDFAYFAKLCTVATNISHYTGTEEYKQHSKEKTWEFFDWLFGTKNQ